MSAPASPRLRLKCRLHPCPAYRVLFLPDADEQQQLPTLTQVRDQAASAWQLSNADGLLLAILDADGDELALFEQEEWEGFLSSVLPSTSAASANPLLIRLCLTQDPRLSRNQAAHPTSASSSQPTPAPTPVKKSDIEIRNEALADSFTAMLHRARSTETPESRAREYASRFYAISKTEVVPAEVLAGRMGGDIAPGAGRGTGTSSSATASSSSKKDQVEKKREDWKARADQLYGSLVAVPPRNSAAPAPAPPISSEKAPAASPETITKQETTDPTSQSESSTARISSDHQEKPDTDGVKTPSPSVDQPEQNPPKTSSKRPKRPVEEVNSELNSAWETMLSRMRG